MAQVFGTGGANGSTIGKQFNDKYWSRRAIVEAKRMKVFSQLGDRLTQPKHYGDTIVKYHEIPILDERNINDQGIDANGMKMETGKWYTYDAAGANVGTFDTEMAARKAVADATDGAASLKSGNGNLYGGSKDMLVQKGSFPALTELGGKVNRLGYKRLDIEAKVSEFGFYMEFTKRALEMDTEKGLLSRYSQAIGEAQGTLRESQIMDALLTKSEENRTFAGAATSLEELDNTSTLDFTDLRLMDQALKDARCPKDTKLIDGSTKIGTAVVGKARYVYVGPEMVPTLEDMTYDGRNIWVPVEAYADAGTIAAGEIGKIGQFRFIEVEDMAKYLGVGADSDDDDDDVSDETNYHTTHTDTNEWRYDAFPMLFVGSGSFATVGFEGDVAKVQTVMPKPGVYDDPYGKKGTISISYYFGMMYLRPEWIRQVVSTAKVA